ncbi:hypothetical protein EUGRSUZ_E00930 [Eucalyptus grandis]|uniref:Uncharacterized protein n=2 Tax=Eucalyptus grandis TaxID=71139 RepID=A0ACC3KSZ8_EUCGR|nr:hypothetical protein EUGRSUZ_E00930 [Eucalyptus grandis]
MKLLDVARKHMIICQIGDTRQMLFFSCDQELAAYVRRSIPSGRLRAGLYIFRRSRNLHLQRNFLPCSLSIRHWVTQESWSRLFRTCGSAWWFALVFAHFEDWLFYADGISSLLLFLRNLILIFSIHIHFIVEYNFVFDQ